MCAILDEYAKEYAEDRLREKERKNAKELFEETTGSQKK